MKSVVQTSQIKDYTELAKMVRLRRIELGISQAEVAERSLIDQRTVSSFETGKSLLSVKHLIRVLRSVGLNLVVEVK